MTFKCWTAVLPVAACLSVPLVPRAAAAQVSSGPMTVQRIGNSVFFAPDFKITDFNGQASGLAGGYGGYLLEDASSSARVATGSPTRHPGATCGTSDWSPVCT